MVDKPWYDARDLLIGLGAIALAAFLLFTPFGKSLFIPLENCPSCLSLFHYIISYALALGGIFFVLRGLRVFQ